MDMKQITPHFFVSDQLATDDLKHLESSGIKTVICHRPDGEGDQTDHATLKQQLDALDIDLIYLPVASPGAIDEASVKQLIDILDDKNHPVLGYCRSGKRAIILWLKTQSKDKRDEIVSRLHEHGFDPKDIESYL